MKKIIKIVSVLFFLINVIANSQTSSGLDLKLGILIFSNGSIISAKTYQKIKTTDNFRIIVQCKEESYIYIINYDDKKARILSRSSISPHEVTELPDSNLYYSFDGTSTWENLSLVIFKSRDVFLEELFQNGILTSEKWKKYEKKLMDESIFKFVGEYNFPRIAGNIRGESPVKLLEFISDKHFIRKYTFYVKK